MLPRANWSTLLRRRLVAGFGVGLGAQGLPDGGSDPLSTRPASGCEAEIAEHAHLAGSAQWRLLSASSNAKLHWKFSCAARAPNRFSLRSYNSAVDDIEDVVLAWVAPVSWIKRGAR